MGSLLAGLVNSRAPGSVCLFCRSKTEGLGRWLNKLDHLLRTQEGLSSNSPKPHKGWKCSHTIVISSMDITCCVLTWLQVH